MVDGGLRKLFRERVDGDWQSIEAESVGRGVPDANYCIEGIEGWIEFKQTTGWTVDLRPEQIGWLQRRARNGGRVTIAVRQRAPAGKRRDKRDIIWLLPGSEAGAWKSNGLGVLERKPLYMKPGGPSDWDWQEIRGILMR